MIIRRRNREILDVREAKGGVHDFKLYKDTVGKNVGETIIMQTDLGSLGIEKLHANSQVPYKESKNHKLTKGERTYNKRLARQRVVIEHINAKIKTLRLWRILIETAAKSIC